MRWRRLLLLLLSLGALGLALVLFLGWQRGMRVARHDHSSTCGIWARGLVVSNRWGEPRWELVYSSLNWNYGLARLDGANRPRMWLGLGAYPAEEPADLHP